MDAFVKHFSNLGQKRDEFVFKIRVVQVKLKHQEQCEVQVTIKRGIVSDQTHRIESCQAEDNPED